MPASPLLATHLLLAGHGLLRALARAGVGVGPLTPHREATAVPQALVAADLHLPLDVLIDVATEVALHLHVGAVDVGTDAVHLFVGEVAHPGGRVDVGAGAALLGSRAADAEDVGEADLEPLLAGDVDTGDSCHVSPASACGGGSHR